MKETYEFLKNAHVFYLATIENDEPRVRPFGALNIFEDKLYLLTNNQKDVYKQIKDNKNAEICAYNGKEWIRVKTTLIEDGRIEAKKSFLDNNEYLRNMYNENDDKTVVLYFENSKVAITNFSTMETKEMKF